MSIGGAVGHSPNPTGTFSTIGGSITANGSTAFYFCQTVLNGMGESLIYSNTSASNLSITPTGGSGTAYQFTITPAAVAGALAYNIYYASSTDATGTASGGKWNKVTTNGKPVVISTYTTGNITVPATDTSSSSLAYPGIFQQLLAIGSGASINTLNATMQMGTSTTFGDIDNLLLSMWNSGRADPDWLVANAFESLTITGGTLGAGTPLVQ